MGSSFESLGPKEHFKIRPPTQPSPIHLILFEQRAAGCAQHRDAVANSAIGAPVPRVLPPVECVSIDMREIPVPKSEGITPSAEPQMHSLGFERIMSQNQPDFSQTVVGPGGTAILAVSNILI